MTREVLPQYPIYIISKGRADTIALHTAGFLAVDHVPFRVVIEPQDYDAYARVLGEERLIVTPFSNLGQGGIPARNFIWEHSLKEGHEWHWILDDNIRRIYRLWYGERIPCDAAPAFRQVEDFVTRFSNVAIGGMNYKMFGLPNISSHFLNTHVYSCCSPETPILCADLVWRRADELQVGQEIVAFDDEPVVNGTTRFGDRLCRSYRTATIERNEPAEKPCYRVTTDIGVPVTASAEHPWLVWRRPPLEKCRRGDRQIGDESRRQQRLCWVTTNDLKIGDQIAHLAKPWTRDESHDGGWISGMFDGEGTLIAGGSYGVKQEPLNAAIGIAQKEGPVLTRLRTALIERDYDAWEGNGNGQRSDGTHLRGGFTEMLRFAGEFRPTRMLDRLSEMWEGRRLWRGSTYKLATVASIESVGIQPIAEITTSTGTFITGGYLTHNCLLIRNSLPFRWRGRYNEDTDLCLQALTSNWCTLLINVFLADKLPTMTMKGGNTEDLYGGVGGRVIAGEERTTPTFDGRLEMAKTLQRQWGDELVRIDRRWQRPQHVVEWKRFKTALQLREDIDLSQFDKIDEYGLTMKEIKKPKSDRIHQIFEDFHATRPLEEATK